MSTETYPLGRPVNDRGRIIAVPVDVLEAFNLTEPAKFLANGVFFDEIAPAFLGRYIDLFEEVKLGT